MYARIDDCKIHVIGLKAEELNTKVDACHLTMKYRSGS